jgi:hypothetical protein|tara:strand:- start:38822 stop:38953 length:132 start_codon:yes stop_codon:yes gene_type:complete
VRLTLVEADHLFAGFSSKPAIIGDIFSESSLAIHIHPMLAGDH